MRPKRERTSEGVSVDLTPMIDVTFQLLIFFIVVTQITQVDQVDLRLPDAITDDEGRDKPGLFTVHIAPVSRATDSVLPPAFGWFCHGEPQPRTPDEMAALLLEEAALVDPARGREGVGADGISENMVVVRCDARAPSGEFGRLLELMARARLYKVKIAVLKDRKVN